MCEACARRLLKMAEDAEPFPDAVGGDRGSLVVQTLRAAAEIIRPINDAAGRPLVEQK